MFLEIFMNIRVACEKDLVKILHWFHTEDEVIKWGGPLIHFPLDLEQLKVDIDWDFAESYAFVDGEDNLLGFSQVFNKFGYKHLGRIIIDPEKRGKKLAHKMLTAVQQIVGKGGHNLSLFVYEDNIPAKKLYEKMGFAVKPYPKGKKEIENCIFMVKET